MIRLVIIDDHIVVRRALVNWLTHEIGMTVVGEAGDAKAGVTKALELKPDIVLMDIDMPGASSFEAVLRIHEMLPQTRVIILSGHSGERQIRDAIDAKAWGYVLKSQDFPAIRAAIDDVMAGKLHYAPEILKRIEHNGGKIRLREPLQTKLETLTRRERELLYLLAQAKSLKECAHIMGVEYKTADKHKVNLMRKLDVHDRAELVRIAIREGVLQA